MPSVCDQIRQKLLDSPAGTLSEPEQRHLGSCPRCQEVAETAKAVGDGLAVIAQQTDRNLAIDPPAALRDRVRVRLRESLERPQPRPEPQPRSPRRAIRGLADLLVGPHGMRRALAWATAAVLLGVVVGYWVRTTARQRPIGKLEFAMGPVTIHEGSRQQPHEGLGQWGYRRDSILQVPSNSMGLFSLGDHVRGALAGSTRLEMTHRDHVDVLQGTAWFRVLPRTEGFVVRTPHGWARVLGTSFGVSVSERETVVEVAQGSVVASQSGRQATVVSGQCVRLGQNAMGEVVARPQGGQIPEWVSTLLASERAAHAGQYLPSVSEEW